MPLQPGTSRAAGCRNPVPDGINPGGARLLHGVQAAAGEATLGPAPERRHRLLLRANTDVPGETLADEAVDPSQLTADDRAFLDEAILDYNAQFGTAYDTSAQGFEGYYKDISRQPAERTIDLRRGCQLHQTGPHGSPAQRQTHAAQGDREPTFFAARNLASTSVADVVPSQVTSRRTQG